MSVSDSTSSDPRPLSQWLGTTLLANLAKLSDAAVLAGQDEPSRRSKRKHYPKSDFYGDTMLRDGLMGHRHAWPEIATVLQGELNFGIGDEIYRARTGDWIMLHPDALHGECCLASGRTYWLLWMNYRSDRITIHLTRYNRAQGYRMIDSHRITPAPSGERAIMERLLNKPWNSIPQVRLDLLRFITGRLEVMSRGNEHTSQRVHPLAAEAVQIIRTQNPKQPLSVVDIADRVGLSPNYLSNLFRQHVGRTIRQFIEQERIEQAKEALVKPGETVKHVAFSLGFADPQHFSHVFKRVTGMSPSNYQAKFGPSA